MTLFHI